VFADGLQAAGLAQAVGHPLCKPERTIDRGGNIGSGERFPKIFRQKGQKIDGISEAPGLDDFEQVPFSNYPAVTPPTSARIVPMPDFLFGCQKNLQLGP
jgi:hypothetical protein